MDKFRQVKFTMSHESWSTDAQPLLDGSEGIIQSVGIPEPCGSSGGTRNLSHCCLENTESG